VIADRYHAHVLRTPREVHRVLEYVLNNSAKHYVRRHGGRTSEYVQAGSSGRWFDGWAGRPALTLLTEVATKPVVEARTWLLRVGWRRHGLIRAGARAG